MSNLYTAIMAGAFTDCIYEILKEPFRYDGWSLQGFGMLRLYLTKEIRMHIWHPHFAVPNVSLFHDHPWDFESYIVCGALVNRRYQQGLGNTHYCAKIQCGPGGCQKTPAEPCSLNLESEEIYIPGSTYKQSADEIHVTEAQPGTVTIVERTFRPDTEHARVFWKQPGNWVSAEPRAATNAEISAITIAALKQLIS